MTTILGYNLKTFPDCSACCQQVDCNSLFSAYQTGCFFQIPSDPVGNYYIRVNGPVSATSTFRSPGYFYIDIAGFEDNDVFFNIPPVGGIPGGTITFHFDGSNLNNTFVLLQNTFPANFLVKNSFNYVSTKTNVPLGPLSKELIDGEVGASLFYDEDRVLLTLTTFENLFIVTPAGVGLVASYSTSVVYESSYEDWDICGTSMMTFLSQSSTYNEIIPGPGGLTFPQPGPSPYAIFPDTVVVRAPADSTCSCMCPCFAANGPVALFYTFTLTGGSNFFVPLGDYTGWLTRDSNICLPNYGFVYSGLFLPNTPVLGVGLESFLLIVACGPAGVFYGIINVAVYLASKPPSSNVPQNIILYPGSAPGELSTGPLPLNGTCGENCDMISDNNTIGIPEALFATSFNGILRIQCSD